MNSRVEPQAVERRPARRRVALVDALEHLIIVKLQFLGKRVLDKWLRKSQKRKGKVRKVP